MGRARTRGSFGSSVLTGLGCLPNGSRVPGAAAPYRLRSGSARGSDGFNRRHHHRRRAPAANRIPQRVTGAGWLDADQLSARTDRHVPARRTAQRHVRPTARFPLLRNHLYRLVAPVRSGAQRLRADRFPRPAGGGWRRIAPVGHRPDRRPVPPAPRPGDRTDQQHHAHRLDHWPQPGWFPARELELASDVFHQRAHRHHPDPRLPVPDACYGLGIDHETSCAWTPWACFSSSARSSV